MKIKCDPDDLTKAKDFDVTMVMKIPWLNPECRMCRHKPPGSMFTPCRCRKNNGISQKSAIVGGEF
jgi:hypothetical protein